MLIQKITNPANNYLSKVSNRGTKKYVFKINNADSRRASMTLFW